MITVLFSFSFIWETTWVMTLLTDYKKMHFLDRCNDFVSRIWVKVVEAPYRTMIVIHRLLLMFRPASAFNTFLPPQPTLATGLPSWRNTWRNWSPKFCSWAEIIQHEMSEGSHLCTTNVKTIIMSLNNYFELNSKDTEKVNQKEPNRRWWDMVRNKKWWT